MPAISQSAQRLISDAKLTSTDVRDLRSAVQSGQATVKDVEVIATRFVDAIDAGVGTELNTLLRELGGTVVDTAQIGNLAGAAGLLHGTVVLPRDKATRAADIVLVQKALIALASRTGDPSLMLPSFGADGGWGLETETALKAFQTKRQLPATGSVDQATALALDRDLRNTRIRPIYAAGVDPSLPEPATVARAALLLIAKHGPNYGVPGAWKPIDSRHAMHVTYGRALNAEAPSTKGIWKCNLFACSTLVAAGFEPPYYGTSGEYPNANALFQFSDKYQRDPKKQRFELKGEVLDLDKFTDPLAREQAIKAALAAAQPGDLVIVDHPGGAAGQVIADGGHCRVVTEKMADGTFTFAQASQNAAEARHEDWTSFAGEQAMWVLRPTKRRPEGAATVA
jgi:hypothetical protein